MASNFFTRPFGLHPTPSTCFPPYKPPKGGTCTGSIWVSPDPITVYFATAVYWHVRNPNLPDGDMGTATITTPTGLFPPSIPFTNNLEEHWGTGWQDPPGTFNGTMRFYFSDGRQLLLPFTYTSLPA